MHILVFYYIWDINVFLFLLLGNHLTILSDLLWLVFET